MLLRSGKYINPTNINLIQSSTRRKGTANLNLTEETMLTEGTIRQGKMVSVYCDYNIYGLLREDYKSML